ncbi:SLC22A4 [Branchiostoma lanceolatum]|uniref:SLC22A4 protein n=1 Tax=Branchiostoma lanceolatum TaxID=7740 RepID=A0A8K0A920_BRALA|nr:SLC22A4 [Branchiostoma lanceolatum]
MAISLSVSVGHFLLCLLAYYMRTWRNLQLVQAVIMTPLLCYWCSPESPRWLISNKRVKSARDILQRAARVNDVTIPDDVYTSLLTTIFVSGVYYALIVGTTDLAGDPYVNFALGTALEVGPAVLGWAAMERFGRKPVIAGSALLAGIGCLASAATTGLPTVSRNCALVGRVVNAMSFHCLAAYTPEVFLTVVR